MVLSSLSTTDPEHGNQSDAEEVKTDDSSFMERDDRANESNKEENDVDRIFRKLACFYSSTQYPQLLERCRPILDLWHDTFQSTKLWKRMKRNLPKELHESAFVLDEMIRFCDDYHGDEPVTILDMCSGIGYLSMFLSHLLPPTKCSRIVPIDILFRSHNDKKNTSNEGTEPSNKCHLSTDHLLSPIHPIPIHPRRANIKKGRELRQIAHYCVAQAPGPVIVLGVHLCKSLSVHTVRLFHMAPKVVRLYLKPCCLPGRKDLRKRNPPFWEFSTMKGGGFGVRTLYCDNERMERGGQELWFATHPHYKDESHPNDHVLFTKWVRLLHEAANSGEDTHAQVHYSCIQRHHFQNQYIVGTRI